MDAIDLNARCLVLLVAVVALGWSCAGDDDDDTLAPLPIVPLPSGPVEGSSVRPGIDSTSTTTVRPADTTAGSAVPAVPVADWDGARFDVGVIESVSTSGAYTTIELDRWSYTGPDGRTLDAAGLDAEPVVAWWRTDPFSNVRVQARTFVLAPDVEVLTLDPASRRAACAEPPPTNPPAPSWLESGTSGLGSMAPTDMAVLTYSDAGLVTRVRLTRGC